MSLTINEILTGKVNSEETEIPQADAPQASETAQEQNTPEASSKEEGSEEKTPEEKKVPLKALQEARMEKRKLKAENEELKRKIAAMEGETVINPAYRSQTETKVPEAEDTQKWLIHTVNVIRDVKPDAEEMLEIFDNAVEENEELYSRMLNSSDPGRFAYDYAKSIKDQEKYGTTPAEAYKKAWAEAEKATKQKVFEELKNKKDLGEKLPKNLSQGSSGSGGQTASWTPPGSKDLWG